MKGKAFVLLFLCLFLVATMLVHVQNTLPKRDVLAEEIPGATKQRVVETYGKLPLSFEANQGQTDSQVKFISRGPGYTLFLNSTEAVLSLSSPQSSQKAQRKSSNFLSAFSASSAVNDPNPKSVTLRMKLVGANPSSQVSGLDELPGKSNYFIGNDPSKWRTNVPHYAKVQYKDVYPGVDLVYYGNQRQLEYDLIVAPGADPEAIQLAFEGEEKLEIDAQGDLVLDSDGGQVRLHKPLVYQQVEGVRREIAGVYVLNDRRQVSFEVAAYDASKPLIIDPVLSYSTYLGGSGNDSGNGIAVDSAGNAYVTGLTGSANFPTASPLQASGVHDAFVAKLNAAGNALVYSTYLGGSPRFPGDNANDTGSGIVVDSAGNAYVTGMTDSSNFPTVNPLQATLAGNTDVFVVKLNAAGSALVYSTYLGGSLRGGRDFVQGIAVDSVGNAYVTGMTDSSNFPTVNPLQPTFGSGGFDAFVAKLNPSGSALVYSTYLGGSSDDRGNGISVDSAGNAYVTGTTDSADFPLVSPLQATRGGGFRRDAFVTKLNPSGTAFVYSTYLGGNGDDEGRGITVDSAGNAYITGRTFSTDFPIARPIRAAPGSGFVAKLNAFGSGLVYSTYLGDLSGDGGSDIAVDSAGNVYVTGFTNSANFPTVNPLQATIGGSADAFVAKLNPSGSALVYSTFLGGSGRDFGQGIAVDSVGNAYVTGVTDSTNFPTASPFQAVLGLSDDAFVTKIAEITDQPPEAPSPTLPANSVVNGASFRAATDPNGAIAPGAIVAIFGTDLASDTLVASAVPLLTTLGDTSVTFNNIAAPMFFVSSTQINAQVPFELMTGTGMVTVQVTRGSETSTAQPIAIAAVSPGVFTLNQQGTGPGAILHAVDFQPVSESAPAAPGEFLLIFCTGLGPVQPEVQSGDVAPTAEPLARTVSLPMVNIAGIAADVTFSGLAPGFVGLYQVNVQVPGGVPAGTQDVEVIINGVSSNTVTVPVSP